MKPELKAKREALRVTVRKKRVKYTQIAFVLVIANALLYNIYGQIVAIVNLLSALIMIIVLIQILDPLNKGEEVFEKMYDALETLELAKAEPDLNKRVYDLIEDVLNTLENAKESEILSMPFMKGVLSDLERMETNFRTRLLPATLEGKVQPKVFEEIVSKFMASSGDPLKAVNATLEGSLAESEFEELSFQSTVKQFAKTSYGQFVLSLGLGYILTIIASFGAAAIEQQSVIEFAKSQPSLLVLGGPAFAAVIIVIWRKS